MRLLLLVALILSPSSLFAASKGALENPQPNDYASGIYLISGWVCDAQEVQILLNGSQYLTAAYGSDRQDTLSVCGDADNGFGVLVNMANLGAGEHSATLIADGEVLATHTFNTAGTSKKEFEATLQGCAVAEKFPGGDRETELKWTTSLQGFQISEERQYPGLNDLNGFWTADYVDASFWTYRSNCGPLSLFIHANLRDEGTGKDVVKMAGQVTGASFTVKSTANDGLNREAVFTINSPEQAQIDFTACAPDVPSCEFTPVGGRIILTKVPNLMDGDASSSE